MAVSSALQSRLDSRARPAVLCADSVFSRMSVRCWWDPRRQPVSNVGLVVMEGEGDSTGDGQLGGNPGTASESTSDQPSEQSQAPQDQQTQDVPTEAPNLSELLPPDAASNQSSSTSVDSDLPDVIGAGTPLSGLQGGSRSASASELIRANPGSGDGSAGGGTAASGGPAVGPGQTSFMNIADSGRSFVYVVDVSSSMSEGNRLQIAKSQLKASLRLLQPNQFFQVIFYSEPPTVRLKLRGRAQQDLYPATEVNLLLAEREIDRVDAQNGTEHMSALVDALSLTPDVVYFLTDGREPALSPADLAELNRITGKTTIHVIEFGNGAVASRATSWLEKLARQSHGEYREFVVRD